MFGYSIVECSLVRLSYDHSGSIRNSHIALVCNRCGIFGIAEPEKIKKFEEVDEYRCDDCAELILTNLMKKE